MAQDLIRKLALQTSYSHLFRTGHEAKSTDGKEHLHDTKDHERTHEAAWYKTTKLIVAQYYCLQLDKTCFIEKTSHNGSTKLSHIHHTPIEVLADSFI